MTSLSFRAGAAQADITPQVGVRLAGTLEGLVSDELLDPLHVRAIVMDDGKTRIAFVLLDVIAIDNVDAKRAREMVGAAIGAPAENISISCTHTHSGPCMATGFNSPRNDEYIEWFLPRIEACARQAAENLQPARAAWGVGHEDAGFNRRFHMRDGSVMMNPGVNNPHTLRAAGPTDPGVPVLMLETRDGQPLAALANFSMHYIGDHPVRAISSDYYGQFSREMQNRHGSKFIALLTHGFSGDINSADVRGMVELPPTEKSRRLAVRLCDEIKALWEKAEFRADVVIGGAEAIVNVGVRKVSGEQLELEQTRAADENEAELVRAYARERLALLDWPDEFPAVVQVLRVGDFAAVMMPGEMFCRFGIDIKYASPFAVTATLDLANGFSGYMATQTDYVLGSYETELARSAFAVPGSAEKMVAVAAGLLRSLWKAAALEAQT